MTTFTWSDPSIKPDGLIRHSFLRNHPNQIFYQDFLLAVFSTEKNRVLLSHQVNGDRMNDAEATRALIEADRRAQANRLNVQEVLA